MKKRGLDRSKGILKHYQKWQYSTVPVAVLLLFLQSLAPMMLRAAEASKVSMSVAGRKSVKILPNTDVYTEVTQEQRAAVMAQAESDQYHFTPEQSGEKAIGDSFRGVNRRQGITVNYGAGGMVIASNTEQAQSDWEVVFTGCDLVIDDEHISLSGPSGIKASEAEVVGNLGSGCEEWYVNQAGGLKHGFTVERPRDINDPRRLALSFTVTSDLAVEMSEDGEAVVFRNHIGRAKAVYKDLAVYDANRDELESSMSLSSARDAGFPQITIEVDVSGASWPVEIDPTMGTQVEEITAGDGAAGHEYGESSDGEGETLAVGAPGNGSGKVYVYLKDQDGEDNWGEVTTLVIPEAENPTNEDRFGKSVAVVDQGEGENSYVAVGSPGYGAGGAVFIFERNRESGTWSYVEKLDPDDLGEGDDFGCALDMYGKRLVIGAKNHEGRGAVFVYGRGQKDGQFARNQKIAGPGGAGAEFGASVSLTEDKVGVGSPGENNDEGAAYVFLQALFTPLIFLLSATRFASLHAEAGDRFGFSIALTLTMLAIGGPGVTGWPEGTRLLNRGAVWVFALALGVWSHFDVRWGTGLGELFGWSLAFNAFNDLIVGAPGALTSVGLIAGAAFLFLFNPLLNAFDGPTKVIPSTFIDAGMRLGTSVVLFGPVLFVLGAAYALNRGAMFRFLLTATILTFVVWMSLFFTSEILNDPDRAEDVSPEGDPDKDQVPNVVEYAQGTDPTKPGFDPMSIDYSLPGGLSLSYLISHTVADTTMEPMCSEGMEPDDWHSIPDEPTAAKGVSVRCSQRGITPIQNVSDSVARGGSYEAVFLS